MPGEWSQAEVEAVVADYFTMLSLELRREPYNKAAHRRDLIQLLNRRSEGALERKHQNISAILSVRIQALVQLCRRLWKNPPTF